MTNQSNPTFPAEDFVPVENQNLTLDAFFTEDIAPEPIDDFKQPNDYFQQSSEYDKAHGILTDRARYGFARGDLFSFHSYWINLFGRMLIQRTTQIPHDAPEQEILDKLLAGAIAVNELDIKQSLPIYVDGEKRQQAYHEFTEKWQAKVRQFNHDLSVYWLELPAVHTSAVWNSAIIYDLRAATKNYPPYYPDEIYEGMDDIIPDPIYVPYENQKQHEHERSSQGFSQWDVASLRSFNAWILMKAYLYFASNDASGWPGTENFQNPDDWSDVLIKRVITTLLGEMADDSSSSQTANEEIQAYRRLFADFSHILSYLWD